MPPTSARSLTDAVKCKTNIAIVQFIRHKSFQTGLQLKGIDIVVSNPPYVTLAEKTNMKKNVTDYEPPEALFVPDDDPLIFYSVIARVGKKVCARREK